VLIAVGRLPERAPGFLATPADHQAVQALSSAEGVQPAAHFVPSDLATTISRLATADVGLSRTTPDIGVVHRRSGDLDIYFVANTSNVTRDVEARFRRHGVAEWWDRARHDDDAQGGVTRRRPRLLAASGALRVRLRRLRTRLWGLSLLFTRGQSPFGARIPVTLTRMAFGDEASGPQNRLVDNRQGEAVLLGRRALRRNLHGSSRFNLECRIDIRQRRAVAATLLGNGIVPGSTRP
jgi:hypothetical protein